MWPLSPHSLTYLHAHYCTGEDGGEAARPSASAICERDATADPHGKSAAFYAPPGSSESVSGPPPAPTPQPVRESSPEDSPCHALRADATDERCSMVAAFGPDRRTLEDALVHHIEAAGPMIPMLAATGRPQSPGESHAAARRTEWT